jgi:hypothetical protein
MNEPRIVLTRLELVQKLALSMRVALSRQRSTATDLFNSRDSAAAERKREAASQRLAEHLAHDLEISRHEVTRPALGGDGEAVLTKLREVEARRREPLD